MAYNYQRPILVKSTSLEIKDNKFIINIPKPKIIKNSCFCNLVLCQSLPTTKDILNVCICWEDGTEINLMTRSGNYVKSDQIKPRKCYSIVLGTEPLHYSMLNLIPQSKCLFCLDKLKTIEVTPIVGVPNSKVLPTP